MYCRVDATVSILRIWRDEGAELWQDFRLSIRAMNSLQRLLDRGQDHGWGNDLEVLIYTYWLARWYPCTKGYCALSVIHRVAQSIWNNLSRVLSFPQAEELQAVGVGFADISGTPAFANVVGAIDGSHIWIKQPQLHCLDYLNYKNFYSINMQAIFDAKGKFLDIYVGYPGSVHDTRVMKNSVFYLTARYPPPGYILLGDGGKSKARSIRAGLRHDEDKVEVNPFPGPRSQAYLCPPDNGDTLDPDEDSDDLDPPSPSRTNETQ
ncbi:Protein ALP1-like [Merluccius polli]|uniref:Protein ALP1-like n=1 Tax=Merluccius polli TaxID=89951 RepID=A0AA47NZD7_MERPO|nr:Protein ALP1-like [Merluccius polli]